MSWNLSIASLIGQTAMMESYFICRDVYGCDFDSAMAAMSETIMDLQAESKHPEGILFNEAAMLLLITPSEEFTVEENARMNHKIRAAMIWYGLEMPEIKKALNDLEM